jgi:hypothetical protein
MMNEPRRIPPEEARQKVSDGDAIMVCAYENEDKFNKMHLDGAISMNEFKSRLSSLSREMEIIFYCA